MNVVEEKFRVIGAKYRGFYSYDYELNEKFYTVIPEASEVAEEVAVVIQSADSQKPIFLLCLY